MMPLGERHQLPPTRRPPAAAGGCIVSFGLPRACRRSQTQASCSPVPNLARKAGVIDASGPISRYPRQQLFGKNQLASYASCEPTLHSFLPSFVVGPRQNLHHAFLRRHPAPGPRALRLGRPVSGGWVGLANSLVLWSAALPCLLQWPIVPDGGGRGALGRAIRRVRKPTLEAFLGPARRLHATLWALARLNWAAGGSLAPWMSRGGSASLPASLDFGSWTRSRLLGPLWSLRACLRP